MMLNAAAAVGGFVAAPAIVAFLVRIGAPVQFVAIAVPAIVLFGVVKGGLLRWAAIGFGVGFVGVAALIAWVLDQNLDGTLS